MLKNIKQNPDIFNTILKKQNIVNKLDDNLGIVIGNYNAKNTLIKVCNPYCWPCSKAHFKIEKILHENKNLKVKIIFAIRDVNTDLEYKAVNHLIGLYYNSRNEESFLNALNNWYLPTPDKKNLNLFIKKNPIGNTEIDYSNEITKMIKWCDEANVIGTPTFYFNGYEIPESYQVEDLKYFLED